MRGVKANSSRWLKQFRPGFGWQDGGGAFSIGPRDVTAVRRYLAGQEEHHRRIDYTDEQPQFAGGLSALRGMQSPPRA